MDSFYCGPRPTPVLSQLDIASPLYSDRRPYGGSISSSGSVTSIRRDSSTGNAMQQPQQQQTTLGYCIADQTVCDGISNCANGLDESATRCSKAGEPIMDIYQCYYLLSRAVVFQSHWITDRLCIAHILRVRKYFDFISPWLVTPYRLNYRSRSIWTV